ncbi:MAG: S49 family peptidase [Aestuariivita sp.]|nr:S49 family peptidase [Aestuariivita sp.]
MFRWLPFIKSKPRIAILRLSGVIGTATRGSLNHETLAPLFEKAIRKGKPSAVAIELNSPGGSPVQSSMIGAHLRSLTDELDIPIHAFIEDIAASGGYWLAAVADKIWADESSLIGSIGVISSGFGAHEFLVRQGFERRVYTAGKSKSFLDPFRLENKDDVARLQVLLDEIHKNFIDYVKQRRGNLLTTEVDLFSGDVWLAHRARELGLIDGIGHLKPKMQELFGEDVDLRRYAIRLPVFKRLGAQVIQNGLAEIEERAEYARYGL